MVKATDHLQYLIASDAPSTAPQFENIDEMVIDDTPAPDPTELLCTQICTASWVTILDHVPWTKPAFDRDGSWQKPFVAISIPHGSELYSHSLRFAQVAQTRFRSYVTWQAAPDDIAFPANSVRLNSTTNQPALITMKNLTSTRITLAFHVPGFYAISMLSVQEPRQFYFQVVAPVSRVPPSLQKRDIPDKHASLLLRLIDARSDIHTVLELNSARELFPMAVMSDVAFESTTMQTDDLHEIHNYHHLWRALSTQHPRMRDCLRFLEQQIQLYTKNDNAPLRSNERVDGAMGESIRKLHDAVSSNNIRKTAELLNQGIHIAVHSF